MKLWKYLIAAALLVIAAITITKILDRNFLPEQVLNISQLPDGAEVVESGDNVSIGTQLFVNHWLVQLNTNALPALVAGRKYSECGLPIDQKKNISTLLKKHKSFDYTKCFKYGTEHYATFIYLNQSQGAALVEYQTD